MAVPRWARCITSSRAESKTWPCRPSHEPEGCPIGTVACEVASTNDELRQASAVVFASWRARVIDQLIVEGVTVDRARRLASFAVASLEGAILLARNARDLAPLHDTGDVVAEVLRMQTSQKDGDDCAESPRV
jgi:hypothetical protein